MTDTTVKYFSSTMSGAPTLSGTAGALISVLDYCLKDGWGSITLTSLVVANNVATATYNSGHNFANYSGSVGPVITIAGATPSGLNGQWRINVTSSTQFTFVTSGISDQTATGTITAKRSPLGWGKTHSGTNLAAYQAGTGNNLYLRVDDTTTTYASMVGYESMSDVNTGTNKFPGSTTYYYALKSNSADGNARPWILIGNDRAFYLFVAENNSYTTSFGGTFFGDILTLRLAGDSYSTALIASTSNSSQSNFPTLQIGSTITGHILARNYAQTIGATAFLKTAFGYTLSSSSFANDSNYYASYTDPMNSGVIIIPVFILESTTNGFRGKMPGIYAPFHYRNPPNQTYFTDSSGKLMVTIQGGSGSGNYYRYIFDISGPWEL